MAGTIPTIVHYGHRAPEPDLVLLRLRGRSARLVGMVTGSSWTTAGTLGVAFVGMARVLGPVRGDRRRSRDQRRVLRRQDDPAVGDDDPGPEPGRRRAHRPPSTSATCGGPPGRRSGSPRHLPDPRARRGAERSHQHRGRAEGTGGRVQHLGPEPAAAAAARRRSRSGSSRRSCRSSARRSSPGILAFFTQPDAVEGVRGRARAWGRSPRGSRRSTRPWRPGS